MCINYGGKLEIVDAVREIAEEVRAGRLKPSGVTERVLDARMYQPDMPPVDLYIRSSGEQRISNFLTWQGAYAEMVFLDTLWPDFSVVSSGMRSTSTRDACGVLAAPSMLRGRRQGYDRFHCCRRDSVRARARPAL